MKLDEAIKIKIQWRKDNYPPPLADEMNADMISIEALIFCLKYKAIVMQPTQTLLPGEDT